MSSSEEKKKRCQYSAEDIRAAVEKIKENEMTLGEASKAYKIPRSTLNDRINAKHEGKMGAKTILTAEEELALVDWIEEWALMGQPLVKEQVCNAAFKISCLHPDGEKFSNKGPSENWFKGFKTRHPRITSRVPESVNRAASKVNSRNLDIWFEKYIGYLEKKNILDLIKSDPKRSINLDESGFVLNALPKKVITTKDIKHTLKVDAAKKNLSITITICVDAEGYVFTPQIIFKTAFGRMHDAAYASGWEGQEFLFSQTESGWQTRKTYFAYLQKIHEIQIARGVTGPYVIFSDGYPAHMDLEIYMWCRENAILYVILFPNATHVIQPCDLVVFKPLKAKYEKIMTAYKIEEKKLEIDEVDFVKVFSRVIKEGLKSDTVKNGFRASGLFPINRSNVHDERLIGNPITVPQSVITSNEDIQQPTFSSPLPLTTSSAISQSIATTSRVPSSFGVASTSTAVFNQSSTAIANPQFNQTFDDDPQHVERAQVILEMKFLNEKLKTLISPSDSSGIFCTSLFSQLLSHMDGNELSASSNSPPDPSTMSLDTILTHPPQNVRAGRKRQAKVDSCGVMSTDEIIESIQQMQAERALAEEKTEANKKRRKENKAMKDKEAEAKKANPSKRGRPKKT